VTAQFEALGREMALLMAEKMSLNNEVIMTQGLSEKYLMMVEQLITERDEDYRTCDDSFE
jgi:hypothetical protein